MSSFGCKLRCYPSAASVFTLGVIVETSRYSTYGNCIWDALGVAAMLGADAKIVTSCGDCGTAAEVVVESGAVRGDGIIHFALPARQWWNDIVFT